MPQAGSGLSADTAKILAALSYPIWIVALITILIAKPQDKYAKYHGFQGLFWFIGLFVLYIGLWILEIPLSFIPVLDILVLIIGLFVAIFFWIIALVLGIVFAVKAYRGKTFRIPIIYNFIPASAKY